MTDTLAAGCYNGLVLFWDLRCKEGEIARVKNKYSGTVDVE